MNCVCMRGVTQFQPGIVYRVEVVTRIVYEREVGTQFLCIRSKWLHESCMGARSVHNNLNMARDVEVIQEARKDRINYALWRL